MIKMKKSILSLLLVLVMAFALTACASEEPSETDNEDTPVTVTVTGSDGETASVVQNPKRVAIYDYSILDILNSIGFEKTGIEQLVVPAKESLPDALSFYKEQGDDKVVSGGTLAYVDWDVLDIVQPELVILGARSFATNAAGESLSAEDKTKYIDDTFERYDGTSFVKLSVNAQNSQLTQDIQNNVAALAEIFPDLKPELEDKLAELMDEVGTLREKAQSSGKTALFCMMVDQTTLSVFNPNSRFDMLYEEFGFAPVDSEATSWTDEHGFDVRAEYVLEKNPDVIFLLDRSSLAGPGAGAENFMNDTIIGQTKAAANGDIYVLDIAAWYTTTGGFSSLETMISDINQYFIKNN